MKRREIVVGERFEKLVVLKELEKSERGRNRMFFLICDCGKKTTVPIGDLITGHTRSCGCLQKESVIKHNLSRSRIYKIHSGIKDRCYNKNKKEYKNYGDRGITVCMEWLGENGFITFYNWAMDNGYSDNLSIDRIDNDKGYFPSNCRWTTNFIQSCNKRSLKNKSGYIGVSWCKEYKKWYSYIGLGGKTIPLGRHKELRSALEARNKYILENNLPHKIQEYKE